MPVRRPRRSSAQWSEIITHYRQSNLSAKKYCQQHDYSLATFRKWQTRYNHQPAINDEPSSARLVELVTANTTEPTPSHTLLIELDLGLGMHLKISR